MANYGYSTPFQGFQQGLPAGYMQAATEPGRAIAAGIGQASNAIAGAIERYSQKKAESEYTDQKNADMFQMIQSITQSGNIMDHRTPESQLLKTVMGFTGQKDMEKLGEYAVNSPGLTLAKKKALSHDLEFALSRYDTTRTKDAEIAYRQAVTQQLNEQLRQQTAGLTAEGNINQIPLQTKRMVDVSNPDQQVSVYDESGNLQAGPGTNLTGTPAWDIQRKEVVEDKPMSQLVSEAAAEAAKNRVPFDAQKAIETFMARGAKPETPEGMVATGATQKTPGGGAIQFENLDAITQAKINQLTAAAKAAPLTVEQSKAVGFAQRLLFNEGVLKKVDAKGYDGSGLLDKVWSPEFLKGQNRKSYESAKQNWIAAILRRESGAAISEPEYKNADKQYFPQIGDDSDVIAQKKALRDVEIKSLLQSAGPVGASMIDDGKKRFKWNPVTKQLE